MAHQGVHSFLEETVFPSHFAGDGQSGERAAVGGGVSLSNLRAIQRGIAIMNGLRAHVACQRRLPGAKPPRDPDGTVRMLVGMFRRWQWVMIEVEAPVLVKEWDLNTRLDLVVFDRTVRKVFHVEIKVGYPTFTAARGTFFEPFEHVPNTGVNQARAQAVLGTLMAQRDPRYREPPHIEGIFVVWVHGRSVTRFRAEPWCLEFMSYIRGLLDLAGPHRRGAPAPPKIIAVRPEAMKRVRDAVDDERARKAVASKRTRNA